MSDLSTLSHEYATNALFAEEINNLILKLKKYSFQTSGSVSISSEEVKKAKEKLIELLEGVLIELEPGTLQTEIAQERKGLLPTEVIESIRYQNRNTTSYYIEDIKKTIAKLKSDKTLATNEFKLLDSICDAADSIASTCFRRLWRR